MIHKCVRAETASTNPRKPNHIHFSVVECSCGWKDEKFVALTTSIDRLIGHIISAYNDEAPQ